MAKEVSKVVKLQVKGGAANPSPPVGPALGAAGVNIMEFCKQFNARTQDKPGKICPVQITVYKDKSFDFVVKTPPAAPKAGPTGGDGFAAPPLTCSLTTLLISLAIFFKI